MYKIIGSDGKEYGPVSADQLRQWFAEGRVNAQTRIQVAGGTEWITLGEQTDFADLFATAQPTSAAPVAPAAAAVPLGERDFKIDIGSCVSRAWDLWKANLGLMVGVTFVMGLIMGGIGSALSFAVRLPLGINSPKGIIAGVVVQMLVSFAVGGASLGGLFWFYIKLIRGESAGFDDAFVGFKEVYGPLTVGYIVIYLLTVLGFICCIIPGIYFAIAWIFAMPLIIDKRLSWREAMKLSRQVVSKNWWIFFGLALLAGLIGAAGLVACCVGIFFSVPLTYATMMYAYEDIFGRCA